MKKTKIKKHNIKKFFKKNFALLSSLAIASGAIVAFVFSGYSSMAFLPYDFIVAVRPKTNLNYVTGAGAVMREAKPMIAGWTSNTISDIPSMNLLDDVNAWTSAEALEYREELLKITADPTDTSRYEQYSKDNTIYYDYTNQGALNANFDNANIDPQSFDFMPQGVKLDLAQQIVLSTQNIVENAIPTNVLHQSATRFYLVEQINGKDPEWSSGNKIKASDFVAGIKYVGTFRSAAYSAYMYDYANITGLNDWIDWQSILPNPDDRPSRIEIYNKFYQDVVWNVDDASVGDQSYKGIWYSNSEGWVQYNFGSDINSTTILGLAQSPSFLPVDEVFVENDLNGDIKLLGRTKQTTSTYGPMNLESFDPNYGVLFTKNENYRYSKTIAINNMFQRVVAEPATAVTQFNSGRVSQIYGAELASPLYSKDEETSLWNYSQYGVPTGNFIIFNDSPITNYYASDPRNAMYVKNPNFRRAISAAYNRTALFDFMQNPKALPGSQLTSDRIYSFKDLNSTTNTATYVEDGLKQISNKFYDGNQDVPGVQTSQVSLNHNGRPYTLNPYNYNDKQGALLNTVLRPSDFSDDFMSDITSAQMYWAKFKDQMAAIGHPVTSKISIEFKTTLGDSDPLVQTLNYSVQLAGFGDEIEFIPKRIFGIDTYQAGVYEMTSINWNPDYFSYWAGQTVYNSTDVGGDYNNSKGWTFWEGSKQSLGFIDGVDPNVEMSSPTFMGLTPTQKQELATWVDDGVLYTDPSRYSDLFPNATFDIEGTPWTVDLEQQFNNLFAWQNVIRQPNVNVSVSANQQYTKISGVPSNVIQELPQETQFAYALIFEILFRDGSPTIVSRNAIPDISPSRGMFSSNPILGYSMLAQSFDSMYPTIIGMPDKNAILRARGVIT